MNYFLLQQYLNDLVENNYIIYTLNKNEGMYKLSPYGKKVLDMFQNRISKFKINCFDNYIKNSNKDSTKNINLEIKTCENKDNSYSLELVFSNSGNQILKMDLAITSKDELEKIMINLKNDPNIIYKSLVTTLINKKNKT